MTARSAPFSDDLGTTMACGILAATLAAVSHETLGHALTCYIDGGQITLLTSIWVRCRGASTLTAAAGPIASLVAGLIGLVLLRKWHVGGAPRLALALFSAFNLFWFASQPIFQTLTDGYDWGIVASRFQWPWIWRPIAAVLGGLCYVAATWAIAKAVSDSGTLAPSSILIGYAAGTASACLAGLMWPAMPIPSAMEGFLTLGIAPIGLIAVAESARRCRSVAELPIPRSQTMIVISLAVFVIFLMVQGRGLGSLASAGLAT
jgi:hypothetical protein